jgi:hypothetical protein
LTRRYAYMILENYEICSRIFVKYIDFFLGKISKICHSPSG